MSRTHGEAKSLPGVDYSGLINDDIFTFIVGPEKAVLKVHVSILKRISKPLSYMMVNGKMEESLKKEVLLADTDPDVFAYLLKFAYQGLCAIADGSIIPAGAKTIADSHAVAFRCHSCGDLDDESSHEPFCDVTCERRFNDDVDTTRAIDIYCIEQDCSEFSQAVLNQPYFCKDHSHMSLKNTMTGGLNQAQCGDRSTSLDFSLRRYGCPNMTHEDLRKYIELHNSSAMQPWVLIQHAKLYALAKKYMVQDLPEIALHKLHRSLVVFQVSSTTVDEVVELILFAYRNTECTGDILLGTADKLRDLIMAYVKDQSSALIKYNAFTGVIAAGGPYTGDFFKLVCT